MIPPWRERLKQWVCKRFGHKERSDDYVVYCDRCTVVLRPVDQPLERS